MERGVKGINEQKTAIAFLSGSAGELDWILPIIDRLSHRKVNIMIVFLTKHARLSVEANQMLSDYIFLQNKKIQVFFAYGYFSEKIEHLGYLIYRVYLKLKLNKSLLGRVFFNVIDKQFRSLFFINLPKSIKSLNEKKCLLFSEYPSLRRPRDRWLKNFFKKSLFFYCPHSPHVYADDLNELSNDAFDLDFSKKYFLLMGHPADFAAVNDNKELSNPNMEKLFIGHPKYSDEWLHNLRESTRKFRSTHHDRQKPNILVLSRGIGSYLDENSHKFLAEKTFNIIFKNFRKFKLIIKKHPREINSHWDKLKDKYDQIEVINDHILSLSTQADFVISFWSSGAMDCFLLGLPVIEFFDPNKNSKQQIFENNSFTTIYRKLGIVIPASSAAELDEAIKRLINNSFSHTPMTHHFFKDIIMRSNKWSESFDQILDLNKIY